MLFTVDDGSVIVKCLPLQRCLIFSGLVLFIMAIAIMVVGLVLQNSITLPTGITAMSVVVKGWKKFKLFSLKWTCVNWLMTFMLTP